MGQGEKNEEQGQGKVGVSGQGEGNEEQGKGSTRYWIGGNGIMGCETGDRRRIRTRKQGLGIEDRGGSG